jgi:hypothetical protein
MILRRITHHMKAQNWTAIAIEFVLVVAGVFLGITAANWNQVRTEQEQTRRLLSQLRPELVDFEKFLSSLENYNSVTGRYAETAFAGWNYDPRVSDRDFVIAAYQASQVTAVGNNTDVWSEIFGADNLRNIDDYDLRRGIARIMTFDNTLVDLAAVATPYREQVRKVLPQEIQESIRKECGDRSHPDNPGIFSLPGRCDVAIDDEDAAEAAAALRARPELAHELRWHRAAVANQLLNANVMRQFARDVTARIEP